MSSLHKNSITLKILLQVSQVGRKIPSEPLSTSLCAYVHRLTLFSSQAARRDQNRIAQREFRLRKQQRVIPHSSFRYTFSPMTTPFISTL
jgi:hypothetical protein